MEHLINEMQLPTNPLHLLTSQVVVRRRVYHSAPLLPQQQRHESCPAAST